MKTATLNIEGMHGDGCAQSIKALVEREEGVRAADVSYKNAQARILYDPGAIDQARLVAVITKPGYRVIGLE